MITKNCQLCGSKKMTLIIDLGHHPLADTFLTPAMLDQCEATCPLRVLQCDECGFTTLQYIVPPELRYQAADYSYTASNSPVSIEHFKEMAGQIGERLNLTSRDVVVDIGSNVGTLLEAFRYLKACSVIGVEPAENIVKLARENNIPTIHGFFGKNAVKEILKTGKAKAITATNTYNHVTDLEQFTRDIKETLTDDGMFVFETPYLLHLVKNVSFDTIYLEHVSYFSVKPFNRFFRKHGLYITHIEENDYMGGSVRVFVGRRDTNGKLVQEYIEKEETAMLYSPATYRSFMAKILRFKLDLLNELYAIKRQEKRIIGIGAPAKGNTLLNFCTIDATILDFITDGSPLKIGKYTPGSHIPIKRDQDITPDIQYALILPWNIGQFLKEKLKHLNMNFIIPQIKETNQ